MEAVFVGRSRYGLFRIEDEHYVPHALVGVMAQNKPERVKEVWNEECEAVSEEEYSKLK